MLNKHKASILQILPELNTGGVERGASDLAIYAKNKGYRLITASKGGRMVERLEHEGCEHIELNLKTKNPVRIIINIFKIRNICRKNNVKMIHARSRAPAWSGYYAARSLKLPFITTFHGFYKNNFPLKKYYNGIMAKGDKIIAVSDFIRQHIFDTYEVDAKKVTVIHRGVDLHEFNPQKVNEEQIINFKNEHFIPLNIPVILLPGRITRWKGHDVAIKAIAELKDMEFILAIAGKASDGSGFMKEIIALISEHKLEKKVKFLSDVKKMPVAYAASDIVLSTSVEPETFGRVSAEANAMGKPVIASHHGGSAEIIIENNTGFLVKPGSHKELARKIEHVLKLVSNEVTRRDIAIDCRNNIEENFSLTKMCENTLKIYNQFYQF